jgi:hypothetical protein
MATDKLDIHNDRAVRDVLAHLQVDRGTEKERLGDDVPH